MDSINYKTGHKIAFLVSIIFTLCLPASLLAQESRGRITGVVLDSNKSVVSGAMVKITNVLKGTSTKIKTNDKGRFQALYLVPGVYRVIIEAQGFKQQIRNIELRVNDTLELDITLDAGIGEQSLTNTSDTQIPFICLDFNARSLNKLNPVL